MIESGGRDRPLDGLRGLAALVVLIGHALLMVPSLSGPAYFRWHTGGWQWWLTNTPLRIFWAGLQAVFVFFLLSGVVLMPRAGRAFAGWVAYYPRRLVRLYLPVLASLVFAIVVYLLAHHTLRPYTGRDVVRDAVVLRGADDLNGPLWTLQWEVIFSLLLPLYVVFARRGWWPPKVLAILAVEAVGVWTGHNSLIFLPMFAAGALVAVERERLAVVLGGRSGRFWVAVGVAAVLLVNARAMVSVRDLPSDAVLNVAGVAEFIGAVLILLLAMFAEPVRRFLRRPVVQWLGTRSFSLYLTHWPIVTATAYLLPDRWVGLEIPIAVGLSLAAAEVFYRLVERPAHRLSRQVGGVVAARFHWSSRARPEQVGSGPSILS